MAQSVVAMKRDGAVTDDGVTPIGDEALTTIIAERINYDQFAGETAANDKLILPIFAPEGERSVQDQIDTGLRTDVSDGEITYGFYVGNHAVGLNNRPVFGEGAGYSPFTEEQKIAAEAAIETWDDLIAAEFVNVGDVNVDGWAQGDADILFANTTSGPLQAWAYGPGYPNQYERISSDVWIMDPEVQADNGWFGFGEYGATTLIHEVGHTLGFTHPGAYNGSGATTYEDQAEYFQDSTQYTIMSYWSPSETGGRMYDFQNSGGLFDLPAQTPLLHDIALIQAKYGADLTTRVTDTTYGFNATAGINPLYDFSQNILPHLSIYDAGGEDTIDLSGYTVSQVVDLTPGSFSSIGDTDKTFVEMGQDLRDDFMALFGLDLVEDYGYTPEQLVGLSQSWYYSSLAYSEAQTELHTGYADIYTIAYDNVSIAYNTVIENAVGGQARDLLRGNDVDNMLDGQGGNDVLIGGEGNDTLIGGAGADLFVFEETGFADEIIDFTSGSDQIDLGGIDAVAGGDDSAFAFVGNAAFSNTAGELRTYSQDGDNFVAGDTDGDGVADFTINIGTATVLETDLIL